MMDGFDLNSPLICEGIIGDGCGGGRFFYIDHHSLNVYDPITKESITLLEDVYNVKNISKAKCEISIECDDETIVFDLSKMCRV